MKKVQWQRPKTTKLYLHRPLGERLALLFPDFKLLSLPLSDNGVHLGQNGVGIIFLHGEKMQAFDMEETVFSPVEGGVPIYEMTGKGECLVKLEAFAGKERNPTVYFKITLENDTFAPVSGSIGVLPRSGQEKYMINQHQEGYSPYCPNEKNWYMLKRTWISTDEKRAKSNMGYLYIKSEGLRLSWISEPLEDKHFAPADYFKIDYDLRPSQKAVFTGAIRANEPIDDFSYDEEKDEALEFWRKEISQIRNYPDTSDAKITDIYKHNVVQCLQMLARYEGSNKISVRQGDIGRFCFPGEAAQLLYSLDRAGLFSYTCQAYKDAVERWLVKDGENCGMISGGSDNATGTMLYSLCRHLLLAEDKEETDYFLPYIVSMRDYIEKQRYAKREGGFEFIFPAKNGADIGRSGQFWIFTDSNNCMALGSMCEVLGRLGSDEYVKTKMIYDSYRELLCDIRDLLHRGHEDEEQFILPHILGVSFEDSENYSYCTDGAPYLLYTGFIEPGSRLHKQMENFFIRRGQFEKGLTGRATSCSSMWDEAFFGGYGDVWFTMKSELYWIRAWMSSGEKDKAKKTLNACLTYGMTEEYTVSERYCSIDPWYCPWQPNGSGSGYLLEILLEFFGVRNK